MYWLITSVCSFADGVLEVDARNWDSSCSPFLNPDCIPSSMAATHPWLGCSASALRQPSALKGVMIGLFFIPCKKCLGSGEMGELETSGTAGPESVSLALKWQLASPLLLYTWDEVAAFS